MNVKYSDKIKHARQKKRLSQVELARLINVSQQAVASWEVGRTEPKSENFHALSRVLEQPISYFVDNEEEYRQLSFNKLYESLNASDKELVINYMRLLKKQEEERQNFLN
ncbi:hypothetical protein BMT55_16600 [Listeria newyorkensis]|uniref:HTH cro/C1-type domain-containing protein n=1 Tax=Listeria newyorkensis TaxID=1497681 RepID=A0ABX4XJ39_9LIST|nr:MULTISPECIES: helix-turn-helix transcriptional regulator [Listeria]KGL39580.1 hypothetical protein EP56_13535 [Listeriaceae bacterium FSL A5-0209]KGL44148.1 hypothetical protein EP58_06790 [Listeria newyorkensis]PNP87052.1 hypothetical protein BMT55_16600 [Listeria newyorkensis]RQW67126.1 XRE family transcriptional regulator [Listeria sp. SHR_NRA_18]WAO21746.1 helix-turn-helix transcriptional regulator [Listeria newyorkensis]